MSWIEDSLARLEARLQSLIEGGAGRGFGSRRYQDELARHVLQAMQAGVQKRNIENDPDYRPLIAPDVYTLVLPPPEAQELQVTPTILDRLARKLEAAALKTGIQFHAPPLLRVVSDPAASGLSVLAQFSHGGLVGSSTAKLEDLPIDRVLPESEFPPNAFLIVNGLETFSLTGMVISIGRDPANHLVLEDVRVSRNHAQLRVVQGRYVIFDLDSTGGTFVNGVLVSSHALNAGDVISLAGVPLVFGQEVAPMSGQTRELPTEPPPLEIL